MSRSDRWFIAVLAFGAFPVQGCESDPVSQVTDLVVVGTDFEFIAADSIPAGLVRVSLDDRGPSSHHVVVLRVPEGRTTPEALSVIEASGAMPDWLESVGGPEVTEDPSHAPSFTSYLEPGDYVLACVLLDDTGAPHYRSGMVRGLVVTPVPTESHSSLGSSPDTILLKDHLYEISGPLQAGRLRFWVENQGEQRHHAEIVKLEDGVSFETLVSALSDLSAPQPLQSVGGLTGLSPGRGGWLEVTLDAGSYALVCFFVDDVTGLPHFLLSMVRMFEVRAS